MKIESVESLVVGGAHFVRIRADNGLTGLGQSGCWAYPRATKEVVDYFTPHLIGLDPRRIEDHWQYLYRIGPFRGSILGGALSAVDIALWDLKGQHYGAPVWDLLGGRCRDRIRLHLILPAYDAPEDLVRLAREAVDAGFTAIKFNPVPAGFSDLSLAALTWAIESRIEAARDAVGKDVDLLVELGRKLTPLQAYPVIEAIARFRVLASEDPIQIDSIVTQADFARRTAMPMAIGERLNTIWEFRELLGHGGPQYVRPDLGLAGGLTHCKKIAAIAESYHAAVITHNFLGPVLTAASVQLDTAIPNFIVQEYSLKDEGPDAAAFLSATGRAGGYLLVPDCPGLGVTLNESVLMSNAPSADPIHSIPRRKDGSVAYAV